MGRAGVALSASTATQGGPVSARAGGSYWGRCPVCHTDVVSHSLGVWSLSLAKLVPSPCIWGDDGGRSRSDASQSQGWVGLPCSAAGTVQSQTPLVVRASGWGMQQEEVDLSRGPY